MTKTKIHTSYVVNQLPEEVRTELWEALSNGVEILESKPHIFVYNFLLKTYKHLPKILK